MPASNLNYTKVQIVDEEDNVIGSEYLMDALKMGAIRRASRVFVFDTEGKFLVQQRSENVRRPLLFDQSVGGHVDEGEEYFESAVREMEEEIGLYGYELEEIATSWRNPEFFNAIYKVVVPTGTEIKFDEEEVKEVIWMTVDEVDNLITHESEKCTGAFVEIWKDFRTVLIAN